VYRRVAAPEAPRHIVVQRDKEFGSAGVALAPGTAAQLIVDAPALVPLAADEGLASKIFAFVRQWRISRRVIPRMHTVVETPEFAASARRVLSDTERADLIDYLAATPGAGELMPGTGGARKLRWGAKGKGKRGGARVITYYGGPELPVFLMAVFAKGERANLTKAERNELREVLASLAVEYRKGAD